MLGDRIEPWMEQLAVATGPGQRRFACASELELRALPNFELGMAGAAGELAGLGRVGMRHVSVAREVCVSVITIIVAREVCVPLDCGG